MARPFQDCIVLLGDSLTSRQEVPNSLQARFGEVYRRTFDVLNRGFGGYNSTWVLKLMDHIFAKKEDADNVPRVRLVTVWLGANDASMTDDPKADKHVDLPRYRQNIQEILDRLTSPASPYAVAHSDVPLSIILITPPTTVESMLDNPSHFHNSVVEQYRDVVLEIGEEWVDKNKADDNWKLATINLYDALVKAGEDGGIEQFHNDGVHLTTAGYDVLWSEIDRVVHSEFRGRGIDWDDQADLPWTAPDWVHPAEHGSERIIELLQTRTDTSTKR